MSFLWRFFCSAVYFILVHCFTVLISRLLLRLPGSGFQCLGFSLRRDSGILWCHVSSFTVFGVWLDVFYGCPVVEFRFDLEGINRVLPDGVRREIIDVLSCDATEEFEDLRAAYDLFDVNPTIVEFQAQYLEDASS